MKTPSVIDADGHVLEPMLWRLGDQVNGFGRFADDMPRKPSEYFQRQCWVAFEADEDTLPALLPHVSDDGITWGSDYPHHDATSPGAVKKLEAITRDLPADTQRRIMRTNAQELYRLAA